MDELKPTTPAPVTAPHPDIAHDAVGEGYDDDYDPVPFQTPEAIRAGFEQGLRDIEAGRVHDHEDVMAYFDAIIRGESPPVPPYSTTYRRRRR